MYVRFADVSYRSALRDQQLTPRGCGVQGYNNPPMRYSTIAPDSHSTMPEFGSSMAGTLFPASVSVTKGKSGTGRLVLTGRWG